MENNAKYYSELLEWARLIDNLEKHNEKKKRERREVSVEADECTLLKCEQLQEQWSATCVNILSISLVDYFRQIKMQFP